MTCAAPTRRMRTSLADAPIMGADVTTRVSQVAAGHVPDVVLMEHHDAAYETWRSAGVKDRVVAHLDAHHDMWFIGGTTPITIANYLCPAVRDGMIKALFWIVPDPTWETPADRSEIVHQVKQIIKRYPGSRARVRVTDRGIATSILGRPLTVGPLAALTAIDEPVLLDIDSDYLVVDHVYTESDAHRRLPWRWPDELLNRLGDLGVVTDLVTIPYSVEGGYTPLRWKYLGDELAARLRGSDAKA